MPDRQYMPTLSIELESVKLRVQHMLSDHMDELKDAIVAQIEQKMHDGFILEKIRKRIDAVDWDNWIEITIDRAVSVGMQAVLNSGDLNEVIEKKILTAVAGIKHGNPRKYLNGDTLWYRAHHSGKFEWKSFMVAGYFYDYNTDWWAYTDDQGNLYRQEDLFPDPCDRNPEMDKEEFT